MINPFTSLTRGFLRCLRRTKTGSGRKYPIKTDDYGRSARSRAFAAFDKEKRPSEIYKELDISLRTCCRYFAAWKRLPKNWRVGYRLIRSVCKNDTGCRETTIDMLSARLRISKDDIVRRLEKPWGLYRLMSESCGAPDVKFRPPQERRLVLALKFYDFFVELHQIDPKHMKTVVEELKAVISTARKKYGMANPGSKQL